MGQVHVASVWAAQLPEVIGALRRAGFGVAPAGADGSGGPRYLCRRGDRQLALEVDRAGRDPAEALIVLGHPPYSVRPWRWAGDGAFFGDITAVLDRFAYRA